MESKLCCVLSPIAECKRCGWLQCAGCVDSHMVYVLKLNDDMAYCPNVQEELGATWNGDENGRWILE